MTTYQDVEFVLKDCSSRSKTVRKACLGATFVGHIKRIDRSPHGGWYYHRARAMMRRRGVDPDEFFASNDVFCGVITMIQPRKGSRAKTSRWSEISFRYMAVELIPTDKFDADA